MTDTEARLSAWLATQLPDAGTVRVEGLDRIDFGHSAESLRMQVVEDGRVHDVVMRLRPPPPGLLEPYDLKKQFDILRGLQDTAVRAPRALWLEETGDVLGRPFYVMECLPGTAFERGVPPELALDGERVRSMTEDLADQIAEIHTVDLAATGLASIGPGADYLENEVDHWAGEVARVQQGRLPALERLVTEVRNAIPPQLPTVTLVHGDAKPGNFAYLDGRLTAVFDWEMAGLGDPRADIGWAEVLWPSPGYFTSLPAALSTDQFVARWEQRTGFRMDHREWFRAFQGLKMAAILLVGGYLYDEGHSDDRRLGEMARAIPPVTTAALREMGVTAPLDPGPVVPRRATAGAS